MQSTTVITNYYNDQLKNDIEREDRILRGEITKKEADREEGEWQEVRLYLSWMHLQGWGFRLFSFGNAMNQRVKRPLLKSE
jgi:hypothetical protein